MTTTWSEVETKLDAFLGDAEKVGSDGSVRDRSYPIDLRVYAWNWAQRVLVHHTPLQKTQVLSINSDDRSTSLPSDLYKVYRIYDASATRFLRPTGWEPGDYRQVDDDTTVYWLWGDTLKLEKDATDTTLTMYYWAYYPEVAMPNEETGSGDILVPAWAESAMAHLVTAFVLNPKAVEATDLNQYKVRYESGNPLHNPRAQGILFHLEMWERILGWHPPAIKE